MTAHANGLMRTAIEKFDDEDDEPNLNDNPERFYVHAQFE